MLGMQTFEHACVECRELVGMNCAHGKCFVINLKRDKKQNKTNQKKNKKKRVATATAKIVHQASVELVFLPSIKKATCTQTIKTFVLCVLPATPTHEEYGQD